MTIRAAGGLSPEQALPWPLPENDRAYPDVNKYGWDKSLPASVMIMRHVHGLTLDNLVLLTEKPDTRPTLLRADVTEA